MRRAAHDVSAALIAALLLAAMPLRAAQFQLGTVAFTACTIGKQRTDAIAAWCAQIPVPENPEQPERRRIALNVAVVPARSPKPQSDLLVFLAGGPGQAAIEAWPQLADAFKPMLRDRHLLLVDQRGTGGSNRLGCPDTGDPLDAGAALDPAGWRQQAQACLQAVQAHADPRNYTTTDAIRDLETLRAAFGSPRFNLIGGSYGTRVALSYLQAHPDSLRSLVLDGVVPQDEPLGQSHARNLDDGLGAIFATCRATPACADRFGDPAATLQRLRLSLRATPREVRLPDPVTGQPVRHRLGEADLVAVVRLYAYAPESASLLPLLIDEAAAGRPEALVAQGLIVSRDLGRQLAHGMELSVVCTEDVPELRSRDEDRDRLIGNLLPDLLAAQCPLWPTGRRPEGFKQPVVSDKPVLLLSGEWDPVTPPRFAEQAARTLTNSRHLIAPGRGHIVLGRGCIGRLAARFIDTLDVQALDTECLDVFGHLPAFTSTLGPPP